MGGVGTEIQGMMALTRWHVKEGVAKKAMRLHAVDPGLHIGHALVQTGIGAVEVGAVRVGREGEIEHIETRANRYHGYENNKCQEGYYNLFIG